VPIVVIIVSLSWGELLILLIEAKADGWVEFVSAWGFVEDMEGVKK
jgi:hypothetical protein